MTEIESVRDLNNGGYIDYSSIEPLSLQAAQRAHQDNGSLNSCLEVNHRIITRNHSGHSDVHAPFGNSMTITSKEIQIIRDIILYMDNRSTLALGLPSNQRHLKDEGKRIDHVHPLCFIWAIISHADLKDKLRNFRDNSAFALKWNGFLGYSSFHDKGFGRNMERYYNHRRPEEYHHEFSDFYKALHLKEEVMNSYASSKNWRGFAAALLDQHSYLQD